MEEFRPVQQVAERASEKRSSTSDGLLVLDTFARLDLGVRGDSYALEVYRLKVC